MRRIASLGPILLLSGCAGFGTFVSNLTHGNPNRALGNSENIQRVEGRQVDPPVLLPEPGDVWPGPVPPEPTLADLQRQDRQGGGRLGQFGTQPTGSGQNGSNQTGTGPNGSQDVVPNAPRGHRQPRGSSTPPGSVEPGLPALPGPRDASPPALERGATPTNKLYQTPQGPRYGTEGPGRLKTLQDGAIVVPNGNGTSTVISPSGSVSTIPTPK